MVSVLMPVYCHSNYFYQALQSIINQDYSLEYEIIIVDNNDLDNEVNKYQQIVIDFAAPNVFYYRNEKNIGASGNWNRCIELSRAPYVTFCHDDDMLLPITLSRLMFLQKTTKNMAIFTDANVIDKNGNYIKVVSQNKWKRLVQLKDFCRLTLFDSFMRSLGSGVGSLYCKQYLVEIGGYDNEFYPAFDYALNSLYTYRYGAVRNSIPVHNCRNSGENCTYLDYPQLAEVVRHFRYCMRSKLPYPKWFLNRIITAIYNITKVSFEISYGGKDKSLYYTVRFSDRFITKLVYMLLSLKRYKL
jgi:glycosyltransferase involved in cell wall biosynthesis